VTDSGWANGGTRAGHGRADVLPAIVVSALGVVVAFLGGIIFFAQLDAKTITSLSGFDAALGMTSLGFSVILFSALLVFTVSPAAGAVFPHWLHIAALVVAALSTAYHLVAAIWQPSWYSIALVLLAAVLLALVLRACRANARADAPPQVARGERTTILGVFLILAGVAGLIAAYNLTSDKVAVFVQQDFVPNCNFSLIVQCGKNLGSWQGSLFGFPNPLIGLGGFVVPLVLGIAILAGARFARWFWVTFAIGVLLALLFVIFLISQSIFALSTLCLWCALVWTFTIPLFWLVSLYTLKSGHIRVNPRATVFFGAAYTWVPLITFGSYLVVAALYQVHLNVLNYL
jgi:uncharacterized membrane protein